MAGAAETTAAVGLAQPSAGYSSWGATGSNQAYLICGPMRLASMVGLQACEVLHGGSNRLYCCGLLAMTVSCHTAEAVTWL